MKTLLLALFTLISVSAFTQSISYCNLQLPPTIDINQFEEEDVYARVHIGGVTDVNTDATLEIDAWIGVSDTNSDPSTWDESAWTAAVPNSGYDFNSADDEFIAKIGSDLNPGTYYYATRFRYNAGPNNGDFYYGGYTSGGGGFWGGANVSGVLTIATPDDCSSAGVITFDSNYESGQIITPTTNLTNIGPDNGCQNNPVDAWFSFEMPINGQIKLNPALRTGIALYSGSCGSLTEVKCTESLGYSDALTAGQTYYIQAWKWLSPDVEISFSISAHAIEDNLDCNTAETITIASDSSPTIVSVDSDSYTPSGQSSDCQPAPIDAWYSFQVPMVGNLKLDPALRTGVAIFTGSCGSLTPVACTESLDYAFSVMPGQTYYLQAWKWQNQGDNIDFTLSLHPIENNDDCGTAESITVAGDGTPTTVVVDSDSFSRSTQNSGCENNPIDAWYSFEMPIDGNLKLDPALRTGLALYKGVCGTLEEVACTESLGYAYSIDIEANVTYYLQAWKWQKQGDNIEFTVSAHEVEGNDECVNAEDVVFDTDNEFSTSFNFDGASVSSMTASCQNSDEHDVWYKMTSPINGTYAVNGSFVGWAAYKADNVNCFGAEISCGFSGNSFNVVQGEEYVIRAWKWNTSGETTFSLTPTATPVSLASSDACVDNTTIPNSIPVITIDATNNNEWINILDNTGNVVAAINANGNDLGSVTAALFIDNDDTKSYQADPTADIIYYMRRYLTIDVQNQPTTPVSVRLYYKKDEFNDLNAIDGTMNNISELTVLKIEDEDCATTYDGKSGIVIPITTTSYSNSEWSSEFQVSSFSKFLFMSDANASILPVKLVSFDATATDQNTTHLDWVTASEVNNRGFSIEHSTNGVNWQEVGWVDGAGDSSQTLSYSYVHESPAAGVNYYRLLQIDFDGESEYSDIKQVSFDDAERTVVVYPNPAREFIKLDFALTGDITVRIVNSMGQAVKVIDHYETGEISIVDLPKGFYVVEVSNGEKTESQIFIKQ